MKIVLQRVSRASVSIDGHTAGSIGPGLLLLVGVARGDTAEKADWLAAKCADLRVFADAQGKMNLSLREVKRAALVVSQFTLLGDCGGGRRPSYIAAAPPDQGKALYQHFVAKLKTLVAKVETGVFGAMMEVELVNDGPVTLILER